MSQHFKRTLTLLLCTVMLLGALTVTVSAVTVASGECGDNLTWTLDEAGILTISGTGDMWEVWVSSCVVLVQPWYDHREMITTVVIEESATSVAAAAFANHQNLKDVQIPSSVKTIGDGAFRGCIALESIVLPEGLTTLGSNTFYGCKSATSVTIPTTLQNTGSLAFADCDNLKCVHITDLDKWLNLNWGTAGGSSPLMSSEIGADLYLNGELVTEIVFPEGTTSIGVEKCAGMTSLERVTIPDGVTGIEEAAFFNCKNLKEIKLPNNLKSIARFAFEGAGLIELVIPNGVNAIGEGAFQRMLNLRSITIPNSVTNWGEYLFDSCSSLEGITLPNSIKTIGMNMFHACTNLKSITLPSSVTTIGDSAFSACWELQSITIPGSVSSIGKSAFWNCNTMDSITIPKSVVSIGDGAFKQCESLQKIYFKGDTPTIADNAFGENDHTSIVATGYYPAGNTTWTEDVLQNYGGSITWEAVSYGPEAPVLKSANVASTGKIKVSWTADANAEKYEVYRSTSKNGTYTKLITTANTSVTHTGAEAGKAYYYKVRAVDADGNKSNFSNIEGRYCDLARPTLTSVNVASTGKIKLSWNAIDGATGYEVYRSTSKNGTYTKLITTTKTSVTHTGAVAGTAYYYKVRALHEVSGSNSAYSTVVGRYCDLAQPTLSTANVASTGKIKLSWNAVSGASKYEVYRSTDNETWTKMITTTKTSVTHTGAVAGTAYYYKVRAIHSNSSANSAYSAVKSRYCDLPRPTLTVELNSAGKPFMSWNAISGASKYQVYRSNDGETWTLMITTTKTSVTHTGAVAGNTYYYRVRAVHSNTSANSAYSVAQSIAVN